LSRKRDLELRRIVHELSNVTTGVLISAGLLSELLQQDDPRHRYSEEIREAGERSAALLREARALLYEGAGAPPQQST
jgi:signal transduction histidine kinase